jgi:hypothetical protein
MTMAALLGAVAGVLSHVVGRLRRGAAPVPAERQGLLDQ